MGSTGRGFLVWPRIHFLLVIGPLLPECSVTQLLVSWRPIPARPSGFLQCPCRCLRCPFTHPCSCTAEFVATTFPCLFAGVFRSMPCDGWRESVAEGEFFLCARRRFGGRPPTLTREFDGRSGHCRSSCPASACLRTRCSVRTECRLPDKEIGMPSVLHSALSNLFSVFNFPALLSGKCKSIMAQCCPHKHLSVTPICARVRDDVLVG